MAIKPLDLARTQHFPVCLALEIENLVKGRGKENPAISCSRVKGEGIEERENAHNIWSIVGVGYGEHSAPSIRVRRVCVEIRELEEELTQRAG